MLDWSSGLFPLIHEPIPTSELFKVSPLGEEIFRTKDKITVEGSYRKSIVVKSVGGEGTGLATHLWFSGNPSKFHQGHNVFGSDDILSLNYDLFLSICKNLSLNPSQDEIEQVKQGNYKIGRQDINYSYALPSQADVLAWIRAAETKGSTRMGRAQNRKGSIYFGLTSEYHKQVFYSKLAEINGKRGELPKELRNKGIEDWVQNVLRAELRLLPKELKRLNIKTAKDFVQYGVARLFHEYMGRIEMPEQIQLNDETLLKLPNRLRSTYTLWLEGHDLRNMLSEATFYRHKKELKQHGINIDLKPESTKTTNVVPLIRILEAKPAQIPDWAHEQGLIHHSAAANY